MSFSSTFNFTEISNNINTHLTKLQSRLSTITTCISTWNATTGYNSIKSAKLASLQSEQTSLNTKIAGYQASIKAITNIGALSRGNQETLYAFWLLTTYKAEIFMKIMVQNYASMLANTNLTTLVVDTTNSSAVKTNVAMEIMKVYGCSRYA